MRYKLNLLQTAWLCTTLALLKGLIPGVQAKDAPGFAKPADPTFSDANWTSMNHSISGTDGPVRSAVADGAGNLYVSGEFGLVGNVVANRIAKWDDRSWSALGSGLDELAWALAASGGDLMPEAVSRRQVG